MRLDTSPHAHVGPHAAAVEVILDEPTLAALNRLGCFYTRRLKAKTASKSAIIRRAVEALDESVARLHALPDGSLELVGEAFRFARNRRANPLAPEGVGGR